MRNRILVFLSILTLGLYSCSSTLSPSTAPISKPDSKTLFVEVEYTGAHTSSPEIVRSRFVQINANLLLDKAGHPLKMDEVTFNLFPDVSYVGVIEQAEQDGSDCTWVGTLKGVDNSQVFIVFTGGIFDIQVASPAGIYEIAAVNNGVYEVIQIDQTKLPGGGLD